MHTRIIDTLKKHRMQCHLTPTEAARQCNLAVSYYSKIENNQWDLSFSTLRRMCNGLGINLIDLTKVFSEYPQYILTESILVANADTSILTYNIEVYFPELSCDSDDGYVFRYANLSTNKEDVERLVDLMNTLHLSVYHVEDVIEDFLSSPSSF